MSKKLTTIVLSFAIVVQQCASSGKDSEYKRNGTVNLFMMFEPLKARRHVRVTDHRKRVDFAHAMKGDDRKCIKAGCDDYLVKPLDRASLVKKLAKYLPSESRSSNKTIPSSVDQGSRNFSCYPLAQAQKKAASTTSLAAQSKYQQ